MELGDVVEENLGQVGWVLMGRVWRTTEAGGGKSGAGVGKSPVLASSHPRNTGLATGEDTEELFMDFLQTLLVGSTEVKSLHFNAGHYSTNFSKKMPNRQEPVIRREK